MTFQIIQGTSQMKEKYNSKGMAGVHGRGVFLTKDLKK